MFKFLDPQFRHIRSRHNLPYQHNAVQGSIPVTSIVIPCSGADYVEEAKLSALFASRFAQYAEEIVIVTEQKSEPFGELLAKTRVVTLDVPMHEENYRYKQFIAAG